MKRIRSALRYALPLALLLGTVLVPTTPAFAEWVQDGKSYKDDNGWVTTWADAGFGHQGVSATGTPLHTNRAASGANIR